MSVISELEYAEMVEQIHLARQERRTQRIRLLQELAELDRAEDIDTSRLVNIAANLCARAEQK